MERIEDFFEDISAWTTYSSSPDGHPVDYISFWTKQHNIQIDWMFKRSKAVVYRDELRDSAPFFSKDVNYLEQLTKFQLVCPQKYILHNEKRNVKEHSVFCY